MFIKSRPFRDHRQVLEGIAYRYRIGCAWRDVPKTFGRGYDASGVEAFRGDLQPAYSDEHLQFVRQLVPVSYHHPEGPAPAALVQDMQNVSPATAHRYLAAARERFPDLPARDKRGRRPKAVQPEASYTFKITKPAPPQEES